MAITFSVIIPHYNSYGMVERTLRSIPNRGDIQIIVIDDNSTERSIEQIAQRDEFSHVFFMFLYEKVTAGGARNLGILNATGEYITFIDSDDYFEPDAFLIFDSCITSKKDLYLFKVTSFIEGTGEQGSRHKYLNKIYTRRGRYLFLAIEQPVAKLIKRSLVNDNKIKFSEVPAGNDIFFSAQVALHSKSQEFVRHIVYSISQNNTSITATNSAQNTCSRIVEQTKKISLICEKTSPLFWIPYLYKHNMISLAESYISSNDNEMPYNLSAVSKKYLAALPKIVLRMYRFRQLF